MPRLQTLALSQINLSDDSIYQFCQMLTQLEALKKLNISNNLSLSQESVHEIAASLKQMPSLLEIDMSKLRCNSVEFFRELADLLM